MNNFAKIAECAQNMYAGRRDNCLASCPAYANFGEKMHIKWKAKIRRRA
jgi:hypothetical protein